VALWRLNDGAGTTAVDSSPNGNSGTLMGDPEWVEGVYETGLMFDGDGDYVDFGSDPVFDITEQITLALWVNANDMGNGEHNMWLGKGDNAYAIKHQSGNNVEFFIYDTDWHSINYATGLDELGGEWHHMAGTFDGTEMLLYIDGAAVQSAALTTSINIATHAVMLGENSQATGRYFDGMLDDARIYSRALTAAEIAIVMEGGGNPSLAGSPLPEDESTDIPPYTDLAWNAGTFAQTHDVYLGTSAEDVDAASIDNPLGVLMSAGQTETTFAPESLDFETTYFWRVDEVNAPPDNTVFKGEIWSFTTEPVAYPVPDVNATASSVHEAGMEAERTVDGSGLNANDEHSPDLAQMWLSNMAETEGVWVQYDLGKLYKLDRVHVWNHNSQTEAILGYGIKDARIEISTDGETWTELKTDQIPQAPGLSTYTGADVALDGAMASHVRITALSNYSILGLTQFGLSEVRFYYIPAQAREPMPADNGTSDGADVLLQWRPGREAVEHEVSFSDDMQAVADGTAVVGTVDEPAYDLGTLDLGSTYYWKIDEMNDLGTPPSYVGDLWTFQTPDHAMVDDMEMYAAEEGLYIWEHWIDGFQDASNGSVVGNGDDAETAIVYEGRQSLPMAYDNTASPVSEATRYFDSPVDLTKGNPESFKLQVRGDAPSFIEGTDGTLTVGAAGADIWGTTDEFRYVYKTLAGDGSIIAKVESLVEANVWTKAGVMIRESISDTSSYAYVCSSSANGTRYQYRLEEFADATADDALMDGIQQTLPPAPVWLKIERVGNSFNGYYATDEDGTNWAPMGENPLAITMISSVHIGLAVTSHDAVIPTIAVFSNVSTTGATGAWQEENFGTHPDNDPAPMYLRLADTAGHEKVFDHPDPAATNLTDWDEWTLPLADLAPVNVTKLDSITVGVGSSGVQGKVFVDAIRTAKPYPDPAPTE